MYETPRLILEHPWINKPDTKYDADGVFKTAGIADHSKPNVLNLQHLIDEACDAALADVRAGLTPGEAKKWTAYRPYQIEEDANGDPTGRIKFIFKRNHIIKLQGGETRELAVSIYDSHGNVPPEGKEPRIFGGTDAKLLFSMRPIKVVGTKVAGVKLDLAAIKVFALGGGSKSDPFSHAGDEEGPTEGGYVYKEEDAATGHEEAEEGAAF